MKSEIGYKRIKSWLEMQQQQGVRANAFFGIVADRVKRNLSCYAEIDKVALARCLAAVFLDHDVVWRAFKHANRLALQKKREKKEVGNGGN